MSWILKEKYRNRLLREQGFQQKLWGDRHTVCLAYPNAYRTGMSNLGFQTIYALINGDPNYICERAFLPDPGDDPMFAPGSAPLFSLESQKPLAMFDVVAFSLSFENDYPHVLKMLALAGIPLTACERGPEAPLIIAGGVSVTLNPEPLSDFIDLFLLGEGEAILPEFLSRFHSGIHAGCDRAALLFQLQRDLDGAYAPALYRVFYHDDQRIQKREPVDPALPATIRKKTAGDLNAFLTEQCIHATDTEFGTMHMTEISRGCRRGCRFCAAGFIYRPARFRDGQVLQASVRRGQAARKKIGLVGTAVSDHPEILEICRGIVSGGGQVGIGSLRLDRLDRDILALLREGGVETVALAPEAGSQRLRDAIHKDISEKQIMDAVALMAEQGIPNIRLYFMIGLPSEREEDVEALIRLTLKIRDHAIRCSAGERPFRKITLSINQFIPKAATPFQWYPLESIQSVRKKIRAIEKAFRRVPTLHVIHDVPKWNYVQALLSLGDRRVGQILLAVHQGGGNWSQAMKSGEVPPDFYVYRRKQTGEILPWDFIDHGVSRAFLLKEYEKSLPSDM